MKNEPFKGILYPYSPKPKTIVSEPGKHWDGSPLTTENIEPKSRVMYKGVQYILGSIGQNFVELLGQRNVVKVVEIDYISLVKIES